MSVSIIGNNNIEVENLLNDWKNEDQIWIGRKVKHIAHPSFFKTWEIIICAITIIGLCVLLGLYYKRRNAWRMEEEQRNQFLLEQQLLEINNILLSASVDDMKVVQGWSGISLEDRLWLLQLWQLQKIGAKSLTQFEAIPNQETALELLRQKAAINQTLTNIKEIKGIYLKELFGVFPNSLYLLSNLKNLEWEKNKLKYAPDVSKFPNLEELSLSGNELTLAPDISKNIKLTYLDLSYNKLIKPPNTTKNVNLKSLYLYNNLLKHPPNLEKNINLEEVMLSDNPDMPSPDFTKNTKLNRLELRNTKLLIFPDLSQNSNLTRLNLYNCGLTHVDPPVKLTKLWEFDLGKNSLNASNVADLRNWAKSFSWKFDLYCN